MLQYLLQFVFAISYVSGNHSFPQPLSPEEEEYYLKLYKNGDAMAKNILIEHNLRLVAHIVKKYSNVNKDTDDLISIGTIGLIKAISSFDTSKGTRLATYAARCIENELLMMLRSDKKKKNEVSLQDPIGVDKEGNELPLTLYRYKENPYILGYTTNSKSSFFWSFSLLYTAFSKILFNI